MAAGEKRHSGGRRRGSSLRKSRRRSSGKALKVLMIIDQFNIGGTETHVLTLAREMQRQGVEVIVAGKYGRLLGQFSASGIRCYEIDFVLDNYERDEANRALYESVISSIVEREQADLIHGHQFPSAYPAYEAAARMNIPFVFTVHGHYIDEPLLRRMYARSALISVSPAVQRRLAALGFSSELAANGIDTEEYRAYRETDSPYRMYIRRKLGVPDDAKLIMYASRLSWEKADICEEIIHAVSAMRLSGDSQVHLLIIGGGKREAELRALAQEHNELFGVPFIRTMGEVDNIHTFYTASDAVIGTGRIALEAIACRRPVIAVGCRGYVGIVSPHNHSQAWNTWFGDHDAERFLTRKGIIRDMKEVILMSGNRLNELVSSNLRHVQEVYPISRICQSTVRLYERLLRRNTLSARVSAAGKIKTRL